MGDDFEPMPPLPGGVNCPCCGGLRYPCVFGTGSAVALSPERGRFGVAAVVCGVGAGGGDCAAACDGCWLVGGAAAICCTYGGNGIGLWLCFVNAGCADGRACDGGFGGLAGPGVGEPAGMAWWLVLFASGGAHAAPYSGRMAGWRGADSDCLSLSEGPPGALAVALL